MKKFFLLPLAHTIYSSLHLTILPSCTVARCYPPCRGSSIYSLVSLAPLPLTGLFAFPFMQKQRQKVPSYYHLQYSNSSLSAPSPFNIHHAIRPVTYSYVLLEFLVSMCCFNGVDLRATYSFFRRLSSSRRLKGDQSYTIRVSCLIATALHYGGLSTIYSSPFLHLLPSTASLALLSLFPKTAGIKSKQSKHPQPSSPKRPSHVDSFGFSRYETKIYTHRLGTR